MPSTENDHVYSACIKAYELSPWSNHTTMHIFFKQRALTSEEIVLFLNPSKWYF